MLGFGLGMAELVVVFSIILCFGIPIVLFLSRSKARKLIMRLAEGRVYKKPLQSYEVLTSRKKPSLVSFFVVLFATLMVYVFLYLAYGKGVLERSKIFIFSGLFLLMVSMVLIAIGFVMHFRPNADRRLKYLLIVAGILLAGVFGSIQSLNDASRFAQITQGMKALKPDTVRADIIFGIVSVLVFSVILVIFHAWYSKKIKSGDQKPGKGTIGLYRFISAVSPAIVFISAIVQVPMVIVPLLIARFYVIELLSARPIIYLRSFHYDDAGKVFGSVITPSVSKYGVAFCIVSGSQKASELMSYSSIVKFAYTAVVSDELWKEWVGFYLDRCRGVIIDNSIETKSVSWEIATSLKKLAPDRVILLRKKGARSKKIDGVALIEYDIDKKSMLEAQKELQAAIYGIQVA